MQKKSQVTLFVLIGLVVLFVSGLVIYANYSKVKSVSDKEIAKSSASQFADDPVVAYTKSCIDIVSIEAGYAIGLYGGYAKPPEGFYQTQVEGYEYNVTIVLEKGQDTLLSISEIEKQIAEYIKVNLPKCTNNFKDFQGYIVNQGQISSQVKINDESYDVKVTYPLSIRIGTTEIRVSDFDTVNVPIRLKHIYQITKELIKKSIANPTSIDISYLLGLENDGIKALYFPKSNDKKLVFLLHDTKSSILKGSIVLPSDPNLESNRQYLFVFGMDFSWYQKPANAEDPFAIIDQLVKER